MQRLAAQLGGAEGRSHQPTPPHSAALKLPHLSHRPHDARLDGGAPSLWRRCALAAATAAAAAQLCALGQLALPPPALANTSDFTIDVRPSDNEPEEAYFQTVPQGLSSADSAPRGPRLGSLLEGPKGKETQLCARKCVPTCIRGGQGAPGLGPMSVRKEIVVFKEGYRTRSYCLSECIQVCALSLKAPPPAAPAP